MKRVLEAIDDHFEAAAGGFVGMLLLFILSTSGVVAICNLYASGVKHGIESASKGYDHALEEMNARETWRHLVEEGVRDQRADEQRRREAKEKTFRDQAEGLRKSWESLPTEDRKKLEQALPYPPGGQARQWDPARLEWKPLPDPREPKPGAKAKPLVETQTILIRPTDARRAPWEDARHMIWEYELRRLFERHGRRMNLYRC
jgi:hypothetical protein